MERLTKSELVNGIPVCYPNNSSGLAEYVNKANPYRDIVEKSKEYEDLEEQGKLLKLPCAVGDMVYCPDKYLHRVCNHIVEKIEIDSEGIWIIDTSGNVCCPDNFGKTVFLTQEEAKSALSKLQR